MIVKICFSFVIVMILILVFALMKVSKRADEHTERIIEQMTGNEYQHLAMRTNDRKNTDRLTKKMIERFSAEEDIGGIIDGCLGLSGEVGELNDMVKKWIFHEADVDMIHLKKELGDVLWYVAMMCESVGWELDDVMQMNVDKLKARYPEGFDVYLANHRRTNDV